MKVCNLKNFLKTFFFTTSFFSFAFNAYSQVSEITMPQISSFPDSPQMPQISSPSLGAKFYTPEFINSRKQYQNNNQIKLKNSESATTQSTDLNTSSAVNNNSLITNSLLSQDNNILSASDLNLLSNDGLYNGIYKLLDKNNSTTNTNNDALLQTILKELQDIKQSQNIQNNTKHITPVKADRPCIIRFLINGYNVLETIRSVNFSKPENDGSFLLTGDRKYFSDNKTRTETFYLLFKADGNCGSTAGYNVQPSIVQDYKNELSFVYQMTQKTDLKAKKTGNLVSLQYNSDTWNLDLLLDIGE